MPSISKPINQSINGYPCVKIESRGKNQESREKSEIENPKSKYTLKYPCVQSEQL
jgi:hypothetical protein